MNKKLKLNNLTASPRYTRSMKKPQIVEPVSGATATTSENTTSQYFLNKLTEKKLQADTREVLVKKHKNPIKVEYESEPDHERKAGEAALLQTEIVKSEMDEKWEPADWRVILDNILEMRKNHTAPVDSMGCHMCSDPNANPSDARFQVLVALMLSSQTKDEVTHAAMKKLKSHGCTPGNIKITSKETLGQLIYPVGFWRRKAEYIKKTTDILLQQYGGDIPKTVEGLCKLPGVGPKMAHLCMQVAWGEASGIGVDTHVHRISNRLGWVRKPTKTPEQTRVQLQSWLPKEKWVEVNYILVGFGQEICLPVRPKCSDCLNVNICPYGADFKTSWSQSVASSGCEYAHYQFQYADDVN
ncbi:endonuclease III-like protein 1 isoform X1 [Neodiprion fabricii]|uniref:endonuclease III-like protein 1 isoform X1 n=1 Tax=Neodiprion fabricii TaxID=2872261 RepID=UPI001ED8CD4F|nr:endonuclease III-like protein 1 isoform X1 [Neodiprion fabricii]